MSKKSQALIEPAISLQNQLEEWQGGDPYRSVLSISICADPSDKKHPYSASASLQGSQGSVLAGIEHLIHHCPEIAELMAIALEKARHDNNPATLT